MDMPAEQPSRFSVPQWQKILICALICAVHSAIASAGESVVTIEPAEAEWQVLFNGENLAGWIPKLVGQPAGSDVRATFRVVDGVLQVNYSDYEEFSGQFGHLFYQTAFSYYRLRLEYRFIGQQALGGPGAWARRNSGVMVHAQSPGSMLLDQAFPLSIEAQFLGGLSDGARRPTANVCSPGTDIVYQGSIYPQHCLYSSSPTLDGNQWVALELLVLGSAHIEHTVNGQDVMSYELPQFGGSGVAVGYDPALKKLGHLLEGGYLALQSESHPIEFRSIELLDLEGCMDASAPQYRAHFVKSAPQLCGPESATAVQP
jgi:hypothetical protein